LKIAGGGNTGPAGWRELNGQGGMRGRVSQMSWVSHETLSHETMETIILTTMTLCRRRISSDSDPQTSTHW
jgi:hypothetical protein